MNSVHFFFLFQMSDQPTEGMFTDADRSTVTSTTASSVKHHLLLLLAWPYTIKTYLTGASHFFCFFFCFNLFIKNYIYFKLVFNIFQSILYFFFLCVLPTFATYVRDGKLQVLFVSYIGHWGFQAGAFTVSTGGKLWYLRFDSQLLSSVAFMSNVVRE